MKNTNRFCMGKKVKSPKRATSMLKQILFFFMGVAYFCQIFSLNSTRNRSNMVQMPFVSSIDSFFEITTFKFGSKSNGSCWTASLNSLMQCIEHSRKNAN